MVSGLYDLPGFSATAIAAAWAKRFDPPMTKVSKVYLGLSRESLSRRDRNPSISRYGSRVRYPDSELSGRGAGAGVPPSSKRARRAAYSSALGKPSAGKPGAA